jgi:hypothetical protein
MKGMVNREVCEKPTAISQVRKGSMSSTLEAGKKMGKGPYQFKFWRYNYKARKWQQFLHFFLICKFFVVLIHCEIYKSSHDISSISYLNEPSP